MHSTNICVASQFKMWLTCRFEKSHGGSNGNPPKRPEALICVWDLMVNRGGVIDRVDFLKRLRDYGLCHFSRESWKLEDSHSFISTSADWKCSISLGATINHRRKLGKNQHALIIHRALDVKHYYYFIAYVCGVWAEGAISTYLWLVAICGLVVSSRKFSNVSRKVSMLKAKLSKLNAKL